MTAATSIEARIPWSEVGRSVAPQRGDVLAMNVNLSDATGPGANWALRTMLSSNPQRSGANQNLPARWQSVALGDSGLTMAGRLYALLVGIDAYPPPIPPLSGCVNDVTAFAEVLRDRVGADALDLVVLADDEATRSAVTTHLSDHLGRATAQDVAVFYFSGHGSQQATPEELWPIEPDRRNETLVCVDSRSPDSWDLADKELAGLLHGISASGCHTLVVLDCCHSGDGTRNADEVVRLAPPDARSRPAATFVALDDPTIAVRGAGRWTPAGHHVLLAACRSSEKAKEVTVGGRRHGALSAALDAALLGFDGRPTYRDVLRLVTTDVTSRVTDQHPQIETTDATELDRPFLGGAIPATPRPLDPESAARRVVHRLRRRARRARAPR